MAVGSIVIAENTQCTNDLDPRRVHGDQDHGLLLVPIQVRRVGLSHEDDDLAAAVHGPGGPPLSTINDIFVTLPLDSALDVRGIRRGNARLGHRETGAYIALKKRSQPLDFLLPS